MTNPLELNSLLRWSIENTVPSTPASASATEPANTQGDSTPSTTSYPQDTSDGLNLRLTTPSASSSAPRAAVHPNDGTFSDADNAVVATSASASTPAVKPRDDLTSEMLDHIMGKSDAVIMREKLAFALDTANSAEDRESALDDFEMLIEGIDNAQNLENMGLWPQLLSLLDDKEDLIIRMVCWIIGTAVQNNPKAQEAFFKQTPNPLLALYSIIGNVHPIDSTVTLSSATRSKAVYALSAALKHWKGAIDVLSADDNRGWKVLRDGLSDPDVTIRRKFAFLIDTLLIQSDEIEGQKAQMAIAMDKGGHILSTLLSRLVSPLPTGQDGESTEVDVDFQEKALKALMSALERGGLTSNEKEQLREWASKWDSEKGRWEEVGLSDEEGKQLIKLLAA